MEFGLLWAALTAVAGAWIGLRVWDERLPERPLDHLVTAAVAGLVVGRLSAMIASGVNPLTHPGDVIIVRGGVATAAAGIAFIAVLVWTTRHAKGAVDALAPAVLAGLAGWQAGCIWRGTCLGSASDLPWAWAQSGSIVTRHPVGLYAALGLLVGALIVSRIGWRPWARAGTALALACVIRLLVEPLRPSLTTGPVLWYAIGLALGALAALFGSRAIGPGVADST